MSVSRVGMSVGVCSPCPVPVVAGCLPHRGPPEPAVPPACCCLWCPWVPAGPGSDDAHTVPRQGYAHTLLFDSQIQHRSVKLQQFSTERESHQRGHVSSVHLPHSDLLLRSGHGAHVKSVRPTDRARAHDARQCHWSMFHSAHTVKLLLQDSRPVHMQACIMVPNLCVLATQKQERHYGNRHYNQ